MINRIELQYNAVLTLLRERSTYRDFNSLCERMLSLISRTLSVQRVSVWQLNDTRTAITCKSLYNSSDNSFTHGTTLKASDFPSYFNAINSQKMLVVDDVYVHPATVEFVDVYMRPNGIVSMLDILLCDSEQRSWGVLCLERVMTSAVAWEHDEQSFCFTVADYVAIEVERFRRQEQMRRLLTTQRLESLGRMAGGVAHGMNNTLAILRNAFALIKESLDKGNATIDEVILDNISVAIDRGAHLTRQLLIFNTDEKGKSDAVLDLSSEIMQLKPMLAAVLTHNIDLRVRVPEAPIHVEIDPRMLNQILVNLVSNSRDAIDSSGSVVVELSKCFLPADFLGPEAANTETEKMWAMLTVFDNGRGMTEDTRARCLEPFYTTKSPDKGTGLGLSTVFGVIKSCGGYTHIYSEPEKGTKIAIYLPVHSAPQEAASSLRHEDSMRAVLLVDDDETLLEMTRRLLMNCGVNVLAFTSARDAIACFDSAPDRILMLITDVVMPEINGVELANTLRCKNPKIEIVLLSGFTDNALAGMNINSSEYRFLNKPFSIRELRDLIKATLN